MWWNILNVEQNADRKQVKRAYSRLIKEFRPETHPEEFGEIRRAYEYALQALESKQQENMFDDSMGTPGMEESSLAASSLSYNNDEDMVPEHVINNDRPKNIRSEQQLRFDEAEELYSDFGQCALLWKQSGFKNNRVFEELLNHPALDHYEAFQRVRLGLFEFMVGNIQIGSGLFSTSTNIDHLALHRLDQIFNWSEDEIALTDQYDTDATGLVFYAISDGLLKAFYKKGSSELVGSKSSDPKETDGLETDLTKVAVYVFITVVVILSLLYWLGILS